LNAPATAAGKNVKCPKCQTLMTIPAPPAAANDFDLVDEPAPKKPAAPPRKPGAVVTPVKQPARVKTDIMVDDDEDDRPRTRRPEGLGPERLGSVQAAHGRVPGVLPESADDPGTVHAQAADRADHLAEVAQLLRQRRRPDDPLRGGDDLLPTGHERRGQGKTP